MSKRTNKNLIIGGLIAIVCIMAVGYAAFNTVLTINASSSIDSRWDVKYDTSASATTNYVVTNGVGGTTMPNTSVSGSNTDAVISFNDDMTARLTAHLYQPGDKMVFTLTVRNEGNIPANLSKSSITPNGCVVSGNTCSNGIVKYTVGNYYNCQNKNESKTTLAAKKNSTVDTACIDVTSEFLNDDTIYAYTNTTSGAASIDLTLSAIQTR